MVALAVLDQSPIVSGGSAQLALQQSVALAQIAETAGYRRYWVAEHHGSESFAGCAPEILIGQIAAQTERIRVGSGGVMLMHYSPLKVAEQFKLLQTLHPNRIDLGIGRAPGSDGLTAVALAYGSQLGIEYLPAKLADLLAFLDDKPAFTEALRGVKASPTTVIPPQPWMLGSTDDGARLAAHFGLPFSFAHFINARGLESAITLYREEFRPSAWCQDPQVSIGVFALCADTESRAEALALCRDLWRLRVESGTFAPFPSVEEAQAHRYTADEEKVLRSRRQNQILGTPDQVGEQLSTLAARVQADELAIVSITHDFSERVRSHQLIAQAMGTATAS